MHAQRNRPQRVHEGNVAVENAVALEADGTNFNNGIPFGIQARRLQVERDIDTLRHRLYSLLGGPALVAVTALYLKIRQSDIAIIRYFILEHYSRKRSADFGFNKRLKIRSLLPLARDLTIPGKRIGKLILDALLAALAIGWA